MPHYHKTIVCLANSRKTSGRCIAGRELVDGNLGAWVRPISARESSELSEEDRRFEDGSDPKVLDIIRIRMSAPKHHAFQSENHLIDADYYWSLQGRSTWQVARGAADQLGTGLWSSISSSYSGVYDRVAETGARHADGSLRLIEVYDLRVCVAVEGAEFGNGKRKVRGGFTKDGLQHYLSVTDPLIERQYLKEQDGTYQVGHALLCISLSEPFNGWIYKLIAAVILPQI